MFTGLVQSLGTVRELRRDGAGGRLVIESELARDLRAGDSVAVGGVCLTATSVGERDFSADAVGETLQRSSLGALDAGSRVNLELPLRPSDRLGGHVVQGHVDGTGTVAELREDGDGALLRIATDPGLLRYVADKGSIAVDGVSLTVAALHDDGFAVALIPETLRRTSLGALAPGAVVNLEVDVIAKYVERLVGA